MENKNKSLGRTLISMIAILPCKESNNVSHLSWSCLILLNKELKLCLTAAWSEGRIWIPKYVNALLTGIKEDTDVVSHSTDSGFSTDFSQLIL